MGRKAPNPKPPEGVEKPKPPPVSPRKYIREKLSDISKYMKENMRCVNEIHINGKAYKTTRRYLQMRGEVPYEGDDDTKAFTPCELIEEVRDEMGKRKR